MNRSTIAQLGFWGGSVGLGAVSLLVGCGNLQSLGENLSGSGGTDVLTSGGRADVSGNGGSKDFGGTTSAGGAPGAGGNLSKPIRGTQSPTGTPYPLAPSVPVSQSCVCADDTLICNAASECVPRCDAEGHCARWFLERGVADLYADFTTILFLGEPTRDSSGELLGTPQHLMRADFTLGAGITIADLPPSGESSILGRRNHVTYVKADGLYAVTDALYQVTRIETPEPVYSAAFAQGMLYFAAPGGIWEMNVDTESTPRHVVDIDYTKWTHPDHPDDIVAGGDTLWFRAGNGQDLCVRSIGDVSMECRTPTFMHFLPPRVALGRDGFVTDYTGLVYRETFPKEELVYLYGDTQTVLSNFFDLVYLNQRLYTYAYTERDQYRVFSFSSEIRSEPRDEISQAIVAAMSGDHPEFGFQHGLVKFRVSELGIYWVPEFADPQVPRYAFFKLFQQAP